MLTSWKLSTIQMVASQPDAGSEPGAEGTRGSQAQAGKKGDFSTAGKRVAEGGAVDGGVHGRRGRQRRRRRRMRLCGRTRGRAGRACATYDSSQKTSQTMNILGMAPGAQLLGSAGPSKVQGRSCQGMGDWRRGPHQHLARLWGGAGWLAPC